MKKKKILLILAVIMTMLIIVFIFYKLYLKISNEIEINRRYDEFEKIQAIETKGTLSYVEEDNYAKVENMDYINQDGIGIKIDSISITDDTFSANINLKFEKEFDYKTLVYGYAIYDENKNIYEIYSRMHIGTNEKYDYNSIFMQRELGIYNKKDIYSIYLSDSAGITSEEVNENEKTTISKITTEAKDKFPLSQKIYIKIFDLGYNEIDKDENGKNDPSSTRNMNLSDAKWLFEFDIPEEMNKRKTINLKLANEIPGLTITKANITETKLVLNFDFEEYIKLISAGKDMPAGEFTDKCKEMLNITDGEGNVYQELSGGTREKNIYKMVLNANKKDLSKKLFVNFKVDDKQYKSELIKEE